MISSINAAQIYLVLLKFAPFFIISFILIYDLIDVHYQEPEFSLTMAIIPAALIHVGLAVYCVRRETYIGMSLVVVSLPPYLRTHESTLTVICRSDTRLRLRIS